MSTVYVYGYDASIVQEDLKFLIDPTIYGQSATRFTFTNVGILQDSLNFIGNFTLNSGSITGGTITELQVTGTYGFEVDVTGLDIPLTNTGFGFSFNAGGIFAPGSTYYSEAAGSALAGVGNDIFYADYQGTITPGGGFNTLYANASGIQVNLKGSLAGDTFSTSNGTLTIVDSYTLNGTSAASLDTIVGSARLLFEGSDTFVQDTDGVLTIGSTAAQAVSTYAASSVGLKVAVTDSAANVLSYLDTLEALASEGGLASISLTDSGTPFLIVTPAQVTADSLALQDISGVYTLQVLGGAAAALALPALPAESIMVSDSAANILANLDGLQALAAAGELSLITLTDGGIPTLSVTPAQSVKDAAALADIIGSYVLDVAVGSGSQTIDGPAGHGSVAQFSGTASQYTITAASGNLTVGTGTATDHVNGVTALKFSDLTDIVASQTPVVAGGISSFQIATLYAAVLGRTPDVAGLAYYEAAATANPGTPITTYAQGFLQSPEYTAKHSYAQSSAGDAQFITDTYNNLLARAPEAGAVAWYQANVIDPILGAAASGASAYSAAELAAHAAVLADFSQSAEFKNDVQVTAQTPSSAQHWLVLV